MRDKRQYARLCFGLYTNPPPVLSYANTIHQPPYTPTLIPTPIHLLSYPTVPAANMPPHVETDKTDKAAAAGDGVRCQSGQADNDISTEARLGLDPVEIIDCCFCCLKLQSCCKEFERWQSFKNICTDECVSKSVTMMQLHSGLLVLKAGWLEGATR